MKTCYLFIYLMLFKDSDEMRAMAQSMFDAIDVDGGGQVSVDELFQALR